MTVKMPEPMTAPMPSAVSDQGPSDLLQRVLGLFRLADQLIDGFAGKQLAWQGSSPRPLRRAWMQVGSSEQWEALCGSLHDGDWTERNGRDMRAGMPGMRSLRIGMPDRHGCRSRIDPNGELQAFSASTGRGPAFLSFFLLEPRGVVRLALGAAFLRAARFTFLRSNLSSIFLVFANETSLTESHQCVPRERAMRTLW